MQAIDGSQSLEAAAHVREHPLARRSISTRRPHKTPAQEARRRLAQRRRDDVAPNQHLLGCPQKAQTKAEDDAARDVVEIDRAVHEASRGHSCARRPAPTPAAPPPAEPMRVRKAAPCTAAATVAGLLWRERRARDERGSHRVSGAALRRKKKSGRGGISSQSQDLTDLT